VAKRIKFSVTKVVDNVPSLNLSIRMLKNTDVLVGIPEDKANREGDPINNATLAYIHDTGSPASNIPARPFMDPGIQAVRPALADHLKSIGQKALDGKMSSMVKEYHAVGLLASTSIKKKIVEGPFAPLKPATIAARERQGREGDKPLIVTSQMLKAVTYVAREDKK
jgi:hypothetical protein